MRSLRRPFKGSRCGKRIQHVTLTVLVLLLTVSIVLAVPETSTNSPIATHLTLSAKTANSNNELLWNRTYGETGYDAGWCVVQTSEGGYIIAGSTDSYGAVLFDVWLIKTDANGDEEWNKTYGGTQYDYAQCIKQTSEGGYIIVATTNSYGTANECIWLIKTDENGDHEWNQTFGGTEREWGYCVEQTSDGGYIISGATTSYGAGDGDVWLIKTNSTGGLEWNQTFGGTGWDEGKCVRETTDEGYIIAGTTESYGFVGSYDVWLIKTNSTGGLELNQTYGGTSNEYGQCVEQTTDEGYIITGLTMSYGNPGVNDVWLIKTDANGDEEWNKTYGGTQSDGGYSVRQTSEGGYIITGDTYSYGAGSSDVWLIKTDANGDELWNKTYGGTEKDWGRCVEQTTDSGYIIAGRTNSSGAGGWDVWLIKVSPDIPVIDQPADIVYEEGSTGHNITWHPRDLLNPHKFNVTRNETLVASGDWDGGDITVYVDGFSAGTYIFTCSVNDTEGHSASDSVMVTVIEAEEEEEDGGFPWGGFALALAVIGIAAAVIIYQTQYKQKT